MTHSSSRSVRAVVCCATVLLPLLVLGVAAQSVDVAAICGRGDNSRPMKLVSADSHRMRIHCPRLSEYCTIESTIAMDEQAPSTLCAPVNGARNTIAVDRAVVVQRRLFGKDFVRSCSGILDDPLYWHSIVHTTFLNDAVRQAWLDAKGSISTVSVCGDPDKDVLVCGSGDAASAKRGEPQLCHVLGEHQAVYTGIDRSGTNGCDGTDKRLYFTIIAVPWGIEYKIYNLSFDEPVVTSVVVLNGTQQSVATIASSGVPVKVSVDVVSPLEGQLVAHLIGGNRRLVGRSRTQPGSCTGYCGFQRNPEYITTWLPMPATCAGATPHCRRGVTASSCAADVQLFESSAEDIVLPYSTADNSVRYVVNSEDRVVVSMSGNVVPLKGVFVFNQTAADRVTEKGAARDLSGAKVQVLQQIEQTKDVAVVRAGGEVATASVACEFALRSVRGTDRMYSVTNVRGGPTCDLVIGNGVDQRNFTLSTPAKLGSAFEVIDYEALWEEADRLNEDGPKDLPLILGLSLGLGLTALVAAVIVIVLVCTRRNKTCCFAENSRCPAWLTKCSRRVTSCRCCTRRADGVAPNRGAANPLERARVPPGMRVGDIVEMSDMDGVYVEANSGYVDGRFRFDGWAPPTGPRGNMRHDSRGRQFN